MSQIYSQANFGRRVRWENIHSPGTSKRYKKLHIPSCKIQTGRCNHTSDCHEIILMLVGNLVGQSGTDAFETKYDKSHQSSIRHDGAAHNEFQFLNSYWNYICWNTSRAHLLLRGFQPLTKPLNLQDFIDHPLGPVCFKIPQRFLLLGTWPLLWLQKEVFGFGGVSDIETF